MRNIGRIGSVVLLLLLPVACGGTNAPEASNTAATQAPATTEAPAEPTIAATPTAASSPTLAPTSTPAATPTPEATPTAEVALGDEQTSESGGYAIRPVEDWETENVEYVTVMKPKDASEELGPNILISSGISSTFELTQDVSSYGSLDELMDALLLSIGGEENKPDVTNRADIMIGDVEARRASLSGEEDSQRFAGEVIVARPSDQRVFLMLGLGEESRWRAVESQFEAVLQSLRLFKPEPLDINDLIATPSITETSSADPAATASAEETATPDDQGGTTRQEPLTLGSEVRFANWAITVNSVQRGDEVAQLVANAKQFNDPPREGYQFLLATVTLTNVGQKQEAQDPSFALSIMVTGDNNIAYDRASGVLPTPLEGQLFPGGATQGQLLWEVPTDLKNMMFMIEEALTGPARFVAIDENAALTLDPALEQIEPTTEGASRDQPAALGDILITDDWEVTVSELLRGEEAAAMVTEANEFNDPPSTGNEFVLIKARVRYLASEDGDSPDYADSTLFRLTGENQVVYEYSSTVPPTPALNTLLFPGGEAEGWVVLEAAAGEGQLQVIFEPLLGFGQDQTRYIALGE